MKAAHYCAVAAVISILGAWPGTAGAAGRVVFEGTSTYHHVRVVDDGNLRTLMFDDAEETRMSLQNPLMGHFEYTEHFHMPWLWNTNIGRVLMIGLGGGSTQKAFEFYYPNVQIETAEIDPLVADVAKQLFDYKTSERQKLILADGRQALRRATGKYDLILLDAYTHSRYGSSIPQHLATREFFEIARDRLTTNGIVAYNVIGGINELRPNMVGSIYRTMKAVFPQVYHFPARTSLNVVLVATQARGRVDLPPLQQRATQMIQDGRLRLPTFMERLQAFNANPPPNAPRCPLLTDDFAPVEGLSAMRVPGETEPAKKAGARKEGTNSAPSKPTTR